MTEPCHADLPGWNPMPMVECSDCPPLTWWIVACCFVILAQYLGIVFFRWLPSANAASPESRDTLKALAWIFLFCGICGYGSRVLNAFCPRAAFVILGLFLPCLVVANQWFLTSSRGRRFTQIGQYERLGRDIASAVNTQPGNPELAAAARKLVKDLEARAKALAKQ